ncbi:MAG: substrate-binding domain-containing protein, partial [Oscillospiraceae bacterium]|nr:substrate-binding domain-containing protein [Oscillospiraceae bacterium]
MQRMIRSVLSAVLAAGVLLSFAACGQTPAPAPSSSEESGISSAVPAPEPTPEELERTWLRENLPVMDGSTSLIPLEAGVRAALFDISMEEAETQVVHDSTYGSFTNLMNKEADLIFSVPLSEVQYNDAKERGIRIEEVPVAKEGFVFVVNAENPVDSLTQQQLRDIYSGKITNWKELGGRDEPIIPYQRNRDSGSQNYMTTFMRDTPLMDAPSEYRPGSMAGLMDVIAVNDHASQSIGYSVYAYAADMYEGGDRIKFLAVDGVAPSKETMASGEYPLISENFAVFRADEPEGSPVRRLCDWMTSDEGQLAIAKAGYVTVRDIGFDYSAEALPEGYSGVGAGRVNWKSPPLFVSRAYNKENPGQLGLPLKVTLPENVVFSDEGGMQPFTTGIKYEI